MTRDSPATGQGQNQLTGPLLSRLLAGQLVLEMGLTES